MSNNARLDCRDMDAAIDSAFLRDYRKLCDQLITRDTTIAQLEQRVQDCTVKQYGNPLGERIHDTCDERLACARCAKSLAHPTQTGMCQPCASSVIGGPRLWQALRVASQRRGQSHTGLQKIKTILRGLP